MILSLRSLEATMHGTKSAAAAIFVVTMVTLCAVDVIDVDAATRRFLIGSCRIARSDGP